jgi:5-deoxy-glucuronate isomerase
VSKPRSKLHLPSPDAAITPERAGWRYLSFDVARLRPGEELRCETGGSEVAMVVLGGTCEVECLDKRWTGVGRRATVFEGLPYACYFPRLAGFAVAAQTELEVAFASAPSDKDFSPRLIEPGDIDIEIRGAGNATRQINAIIHPHHEAHRLEVVEVYTPAGNWSSYPPHKHDVDDMPAEAKLEEVYYYKVQGSGGYAIQRVYTKDGELDEAIVARDGDLVLVPRGYHPVVAAHGYNVYYLNALAGDTRTMAASDDPDYAWVRDTWASLPKDIRLVK